MDKTPKTKPPRIFILGGREFVSRYYTTATAFKPEALDIRRRLPAIRPRSDVMTDTSPVIQGLQSPGPAKLQIHSHITIVSGEIN